MEKEEKEKKRAAKAKAEGNNGHGYGADLQRTIRYHCHTNAKQPKIRVQSTVFLVVFRPSVSVRRSGHNPLSPLCSCESTIRYFMYLNLQK